MRLTLEELMRLRDIKGKELAVKTGYTEATISHLRKRRNKPRLETAVEIAKALGVDITDIEF